MPVVCTAGVAIGVALALTAAGAIDAVVMPVVLAVCVAHPIAVADVASVAVTAVAVRSFRTRR